MCTQLLFGTKNKDRLMTYGWPQGCQMQNNNTHNFREVGYKIGTDYFPNLC